MMHDCECSERLFGVLWNRTTPFEVKILLSWLVQLRFVSKSFGISKKDASSSENF